MPDLTIIAKVGADGMIGWGACARVLRQELLRPGTLRSPELLCVGGTSWWLEGCVLWGDSSQVISFDNEQRFQCRSFGIGCREPCEMQAGPTCPVLPGAGGARAVTLAGAGDSPATRARSAGHGQGWRKGSSPFGMS